MSVIRRRRAADAISGVRPGAAVAVARVWARVLECAGRRAAFVTRRARRVVLAVVLALAGEVGAAGGGQGGRWFVVVGARGGGAWWALGGRGVGRHHLRGLGEVRFRTLVSFGGIDRPALVRRA